MASIQRREGKKGVSYRIRICVGNNRDGSPNMESMTWKPPAGMTKRQADKQAQREADKFEELIRKGINTDKITFKEVSKQYIDFINGTQKPSSVRGHSERLKLINDQIGGVEIKALTKQNIRDFISFLEMPYKTKTGIEKHRSAATISDYYKTISCILSFACESDYIEHNICVGKGIRKPKQASETDKSVPIDVLQGYSEMLETAPLQDRLFFHLTLATGMRRGEVLGLAWPNVDIENNIIRIVDNSQWIPKHGIVFLSTKRKASDRTIKIPEYISSMLRELKLQQIENQLKAGPCWKANPENPKEKYCENHNECNRPCTGFCSRNCRMFKETARVFCNELGHPIHPYTPLKNIQKLGARAGLPKITIHSLRHTAASIAIQNGESITDISAFLGHSSPRITMDIYAHAVKEREQARKLQIEITSVLKQAK